MSINKAKFEEAFSRVQADYHADQAAANYPGADLGNTGLRAQLAGLPVEFDGRKLLGLAYLGQHY